jgi:hypothetical protein
MSLWRVNRYLGLAAAIALVVGCSKKKEPVGPTAGDLTVSYSSGTGNDGALLVLVTGPATSIQALGGYQISQASVGPNMTRVVLTGTINSGDILKLAVPDVDDTASYTIKVEAAADRATFALADQNLYTTTIRK